MTLEELADLKLKIATAESQYAKLVSGTLVSVFIDQNGEQVRYSATARGDLYAYITSLKAQLPRSDPGFQGYPRPLQFLFGA